MRGGGKERGGESDKARGGGEGVRVKSYENGVMFGVRNKVNEARTYVFKRCMSSRR